MKESDIDRELLLRFKVPEESTASDKKPLRIEAEIIRANVRPPYTLCGYVLLPMEEAEKESGKTGNENEPQRSDNVKERERYVKLPFGMMDIVAPIQIKEPFLVFPYEDAKAVRQQVKAGNIVLVGVEALPLTPDDEGKLKKLDVDVKVNRVLSW